MEQRLWVGIVSGEPQFDVIVLPPKKVVSVKLEVDLIEEIDRLWPRLGYRSRSDFIREAIIYYMQVVGELRGSAETEAEAAIEEAEDADLL